MIKRNIISRLKSAQRGQSYIELTLILMVLLTMLVGMVEFGNLLNQYITLVDGAREGARYVSNDDPFDDGSWKTIPEPATAATFNTPDPDVAPLRVS